MTTPAPAPTPATSNRASSSVDASAASSRITRTYDYEGRSTDVARMLSMPGLDYLRGILTGEYPAAPIAATLGFHLVEVDVGRAVFEGTPERYAYNPLGGVHGGWAATLLDSALGCAVHTTLPAGKGYTTVDLSVSLVRGITDRTRLIRCEAAIIHTGGTIATAGARLVDAGGQLYAHGTATCLILSPR
jgi:uncharacterized protein (TIGR00369 family)